MGGSLLLLLLLAGGLGLLRRLGWVMGLALHLERGGRLLREQQLLLVMRCHRRARRGQRMLQRQRQRRLQGVLGQLLLGRRH